MLSLISLDMEIQRTLPTLYQPIAQASSDDELVRLWLHGRPFNTQRAYRREIERFKEFVQKPFQITTLGDVQLFADSISSLKPSSVARSLAAIKSMLSFAHQIGYLQFNVGLPVRLAIVRNRRAERILTEEQVMKMLALTKSPRDHALLRLAYSSALRISELASLSWQDLTQRGEAGQVSVLSKGGKTHTVLLSSGTWAEITKLGGTLGSTESPVFVSQMGSRLSVAQINRIVGSAARRAGISSKVSMHCLRHAHASHSLIHLVLGSSWLQSSSKMGTQVVRKMQSFQKINLMAPCIADLGSFELRRTRNAVRCKPPRVRIPPGPPLLDQLT